MSIDHDGAQIAKLLRPYWTTLLELGWDDADNVLGGIDASFSLEMETAQQALDGRAKLVKGVVETTKEQIRSILGQAAREGHGTDWVTEQIKKLKEIAASRAELIARTEAAAMYSKGSLIAYAESGQVSGTEWLLGPEPCPECQPLGGKVAALGEAFDGDVECPPLHPRCTCAIAPVLSE